LHCGTTQSVNQPQPDHHHPDPTTGANRKSWADQRFTYARQAPIKIKSQQLTPQRSSVDQGLVLCQPGGDALELADGDPAVGLRVGSLVEALL
jgi:hypothetical protein